MIVLLSLLFLSISGVVLWYRWAFNNHKENILLQLDSHNTCDKEYTLAVINYLKNQGKQVQFLGNRQFLIDGQSYTLHEISMPIGASLSIYPILKKE